MDGVDRQHHHLGLPGNAQRVDGRYSSNLCQWYGQHGLSVAGPLAPHEVQEPHAADYQPDSRDADNDPADSLANLPFEGVAALRSTVRSASMDEDDGERKAD